VPEAFVVPVAGLIVPQDPAGDGETLKVTLSLATATPAGDVTVAVTDAAPAPLAGTAAGDVVTVTVLGGPVWVMTAEPVWA
jgi:hypothetical protein